ncbi:hypothetical protein FKR81_32335 [Lentzea tibetensis]|uniref:DUF6545 domain-containing protein n=1 Tax=Lentzea tibetensis TaxID=2591470 RepID=A0A563EK26_9PSEU|nr:MAB_1171c family putative transporter [Lentzea tibetensis]TWP47404.1 hypothetical protein FKR81_32335 [Lentzea tibetensis]
MIFFFATVLSVTAALTFWVRSYQQSRKPGVRAMCLSLLLLDLALCLGVKGGPVEAGIGVPGLAQFIQHVCVLTSAYWLQVFCLHLTHRPDETAPLTRRRAITLAVALIGLSTFYVLGPLQSDLVFIPSSAGDQPWVPQYLAMYGGYLSLAMLDTLWMSRLASHVPRRFLRIGLRLLGIGSIFGLLYVIHRLGYGFARAFGIVPPWDENGPLGPSLWFVTLAIVFLMSGVMAPPLGARREARQAVAVVRPLWSAVTAVAPELVFGSRRGPLLRMQITEIQDVLIGPLHAYLDPLVLEHAQQRAEQDGLVGEDARAVAEAAVIAVALEATRLELPPLTSTPVVIGNDDDLDDASEGQRLVRVAQAFTESPLVSAIVEEYLNLHDHAK